MNRVCVFCGSSSGARAEYALVSAQTGALIVRRGLGLVYGGGRVGLMGLTADAALRAGGPVIGVITQALKGRGGPHRAHGTARRPHDARAKGADGEPQ